MEKETKKQIFPSIRESLIAEIVDLANKERRSFSDMVSLLLESALKERKRKRSSSKLGN